MKVLSNQEQEILLAKLKTTMSKKTRRMLDSLTINQICDCAFRAACDCEADYDMFVRLFGQYVRIKFAMTMGNKTEKRL